ncbi:MAG: hypothetical protein WAL22_22655 [Solirubrobacteraceae bacterium]
MAERLKRASFVRIAVGLAALALPLFAVGTAQAAIAGAPAESTINRPDLVSATALTNTSVDFCFDKAINNAAFAGGNFAIGGYRQARFVTATSAVLEQTFVTNNTCVRATFPATVGDIGQYTYGSVNTGAVSTVPGATNPLVDSTTLTVPAALNPTHNGTTGFTVAPDLVGVTTDATTNTVTYTEDQVVATAAGPFTLVRSGGSVCTSTGVTANGDNTVTVAFNRLTCPVTDAQRATQAAGAVTAAADPGIPSPAETAIVPNTSGTTVAPDLVSATLEANGGAIDYTFDKSVAVSAAGATGFRAVLSTGTSVPSTSAQVIASTSTTTTIRATFAFAGLVDLSQINEYVVIGGVTAGSVTETSAPFITNPADSRPAGDNAGAFARGFTTGPDAISAVVSKSTGVVTVTLDQRAFTANPAAIFAVDNTGNAFGSPAAGGVSLPTQAAGPQTIRIAFSTAQAGSLANLDLQTGALTTLIGETNANQILSVTSTATLLHRAKLARAHKVSAHAVKAHAALVRKEERRMLNKLSRQLHHRV